MSVYVACDACRTAIVDVVYVLSAEAPETIDQRRTVGRNHLHWDCIPTFGRTPATGGPPADVVVPTL